MSTKLRIFKPDMMGIPLADVPDCTLLQFVNELAGKYFFKPVQTYEDLQKYGEHAVTLVCISDGKISHDFDASCQCRIFPNAYILPGIGSTSLDDQ